MRAGVEGGARILEAAGAATVFTTHARWVAYEPSRGERVEALLERADAAGWGPGQYNFSSFHIMGTARMGGRDGTYACNPDGETWEVRDLVVCDGSVFPTAPGVNPMISIEALSHLNARKLAARLS
jgi:choline dehydrogenase-like flavoprotein